MSEQTIDASKLKKAEKKVDAEEVVIKPTSVSAGAVDKALDLAFNPTRDKLREVTIIDRVQGRFFPQLDMINHLRSYCLEIAYYREDPVAYKAMFEKDRPVQPNATEEFLFRTAQWQKSVAGKNLEKITDIALAETETRVDEDELAADKADSMFDE